MNEKPLGKKDFIVVMIPYFVEVITDDIPDHIRMLRF